MRQPVYLFINGLCILTIVGVSLPLYLFAYTMGSSNYRIDSDSLNSGGSSFSTSTNYSMGDTVGEVGTGYSTSTSYSMTAGYWNSKDAYISISDSQNVTLSSLSGVAGGVSTASSSWGIITNNTLGYQLTISASTNPALKATEGSIADYIPAGSDPDFTFSVGSTDSLFGFSPEGSDITSRYKDNGSSCNTGSSDTTSACWDGFSTSEKIIAQSTVSNEPFGATTTLQYQVGIGSGRLQEASTGYAAYITVTATTL